MVETPLNNAEFQLTVDEWESIKPEPRKSGGYAFAGNWTHLLSQKIKETNPTCSFTFKYNRIKANAEKRSGPYFLGKALCKCGVHATITIPHGKEKDRKFRITYDGNSLHSLDSEFARPISNEKRAELKSKLAHVKPSTFYHQSLNAMSPRSFLAGNQDDFGTLPALRKIRSEARNPCFTPVEKSTHAPHVHLLQVAEAMRKSDMEDAKLISAAHFDSRSLFGFIQEIHIEPMRLLLWNEAAIRLWHDLCASQRTFWDATGSLVKKEPGQEKRILNYFLLVDHPVASEPPLMVAEMVSNDHSMTSLQYFISRFRYAEAMLFGHKNVSMPRVMESDFSLVFILAALKEFNGESLPDFLERAWRIANKTHSEKDVKLVGVHVCTSHFMRRLYVRVKKLVPSKKQVPFIMHALAVCVNASSLKELSEYVTALLIILGSKSIHLEVESAYQRLKQGINSLENPTKERRHATDDIPAGEDMAVHRKTDLNAEESDEEKALRRSPSSPFASYFTNIWKKKNMVNKDAKCEPNSFFLPGLCEMLLEEYLPTAPLWSGILLPAFLYDNDTSRNSHVTRLTSGKMENSIKALKEEDFNGEKRLPLHIYADKRYQMTLGRQRLFFKGVVRGRKAGSKPTKGQVNRLQRSLNLPNNSKEDEAGKKKRKPIQEKWNKKLRSSLSKTKKFPNLGRFQQSPVKPFPDKLSDIVRSLESKVSHGGNGENGKKGRDRTRTIDGNKNKAKTSKTPKKRIPMIHKDSVKEDHGGRSCEELHLLDSASVQV